MWSDRSTTANRKMETSTIDIPSRCIFHLFFNGGCASVFTLSQFDTIPELTDCGCALSIFKVLY